MVEDAPFRYFSLSVRRLLNNRPSNKRINEELLEGINVSYINKYYIIYYFLLLNLHSQILLSGLIF